jgi:hypothetical protein
MKYRVTHARTGLLDFVLFILASHHKFDTCVAFKSFSLLEPDRSSSSWLFLFLTSNTTTSIIMRKGSGMYGDGRCFECGKGLGFGIYRYCTNECMAEY